MGNKNATINEKKKKKHTSDKATEACYIFNFWSLTAVSCSLTYLKTTPKGLHDSRVFGEARPLCNYHWHFKKNYWRNKWWENFWIGYTSNIYRPKTWTKIIPASEKTPPIEMTESSWRLLSRSLSTVCCTIHNFHTCDTTSGRVLCPSDCSRCKVFPDIDPCILLEAPQLLRVHQACQSKLPYHPEICYKLDKCNDYKCMPESMPNAYNGHKAELWLQHLMWIRNHSKLDNLFPNLFPGTYG